MINYTIIEVPDMNDSLSRITLDNTVYNIRFTYIDSMDYWTFSLYDSQNEPIIIGIKIVPNFPLNLFLCESDMPYGVFEAISKNDRIGRQDFVNGNVDFVFAPVKQ